MRGTPGTELMGQISSGELRFKQSDIATEIKGNVSAAMEEIITMGARIRPLVFGGQRVGWMRPMGLSERKQLDRLFSDPVERIFVLLRHSTTLQLEDINSLDSKEANNLLNLLYKASLADLSLFPYIYPFTTTQISANLWASRSERLLGRTTIDLPDDSQFKLLAPSDHVTLWATLASFRHENQAKLEQTINFSTLIRAWSGKSADKYVHDLGRELQTYRTDQIEPWVEVVDFIKYTSKNSNVNDGFGHSHEDDTVQGLLREMQGMLEGDKHEQIMDTFYQAQFDTAARKEEELQAIIQKRREELETLPDDTMVVLTDSQVRQREREIRDRSMSTRLQVAMAQELEGQGDDDDVQATSDRLKKYF